MIYLHKILPTFVLPIMLFIIVILIGLFKNKKKLIYIAIGALYILSTPIFSNNFFKLVEGSEYRKPINTIDSADAIVVLSGMLGINEVGDNTYIEWGDPDRFFGGIALFKAGKAQKLVFTKGKMPWDKLKNTEGDILKKFALENNIPNENILLTSFVENTEDFGIFRIFTFLNATNNIYKCRLSPICGQSRLVSKSIVLNMHRSGRLVSRRNNPELCNITLYHLGQRKLRTKSDRVDVVYS